MGFGDFFNDLARPFYEASMYQANGPDWRNKIEQERLAQEQLRANIEHTRATTASMGPEQMLRDEEIRQRTAGAREGRIKNAASLFASGMGPVIEAQSHQLPPDQAGPNPPIPAAPDITKLMGEDLLPYADAIKALGTNEATTAADQSKSALQAARLAAQAQHDERTTSSREHQAELTRTNQHDLQVERLLAAAIQGGLNRDAANSRSGNSLQVSIWRTMFTDAARRGENLQDLLMRQRLSVDHMVNTGQISPDEGSQAIGTLAAVASQATREANSLRGGPTLTGAPPAAPTSIPGGPTAPPQGDNGDMFADNFPLLPVGDTSGFSRYPIGQKFHTPGTDLLKVKTGAATWDWVN